MNSILHAPWLIPLMLIIIIGGAAYLIISPTRQKQQEKINQDVAHGKMWQAQCPSCQRWKQQKPIETNRMQGLENPISSPIPGTQYPFMNRYKCPFCGHKWEEQYLE